MKGVMEPSSNRNNYISTWWNSSRIAAVSTFSLVLMDSAVVSQPCPHWMSRGATPWSEYEEKAPGNPADLGRSHQVSADSPISWWALLKEQRVEWKRNWCVFPSLFPALGPGCSQGRSRGDLSLTLGVWEKVFCTVLCFSRFSALSRVKWQIGSVSLFKSAWDTENYFHHFCKPSIL